MKVGICKNLKAEHYCDLKGCSVVVTVDPEWKHHNYDLAHIALMDKPGFFRKDGHAVVWAKTGDAAAKLIKQCPDPVSYTHLRAHET